MKTVKIFTDGACLGNPGPGGWAAVLECDGVTRELVGSEPDTTNNRMELTAVIRALSALTRPSKADLTTDSRYVKNGAESWLSNWRRNGFKTADRKPVKNQDLWLELDRLLDIHDVAWRWTKGHAGNPLNERVDSLANAAAHSV